MSRTGHTLEATVSNKQRKWRVDRLFELGQPLGLSLTWKALSLMMSDQSRFGPTLPCNSLYAPNPMEWSARGHCDSVKGYRLQAVEACLQPSAHLLLQVCHGISAQRALQRGRQPLCMNSAGISSRITTSLFSADVCSVWKTLYTAFKKGPVA